MEKCFVGLRPSAAGHPPKRCDRFYCLTWQFSKSNVRVKTGNPQAFEKDVPCQNHDWKLQFGLLNFFAWRETGLGHGRKSFPLKGTAAKAGNHILLLRMPHTTCLTWSKRQPDLFLPVKTGRCLSHLPCLPGIFCYRAFPPGLIDCRLFGRKMEIEYATYNSAIAILRNQQEGTRGQEGIA